MKPSYTEFEELVRKDFSRTMPNLDSKQIDDFIKSEDAQDAIRAEYDYSVVRLESGTISSEMFRTGCVSAAASCLYMLY